MLSSREMFVYSTALENPQNQQINMSTMSNHE